MKKINLLILALLSIISLYGCYESEIALSEKPTSRVDMRLIGSWSSVEDLVPKELLIDTKMGSEFKPSILSIKKFNEKEYLVAWKEDGEDTHLRRAFITEFNTTNILNIQDIESEGADRSFIFSKFEFNKKGNLVIHILDENFPGLEESTFNSSKDFYTFIQKNISKEGLFEASIQFEPSDDIVFDIESY